jgi:hypothetical protein
MIKEKVTEFSFGPMVVNILVHGKQGNNMVLELTLVKKVSLNKVSGRTDERSVGLVRKQETMIFKKICNE